MENILKNANGGMLLTASIKTHLFILAQWLQFDAQKGWFYFLVPQSHNTIKTKPKNNNWQIQNCFAFELNT